MDGKCLVMGASGFLGGNVARQLCEAGEDVRVFTRHTSSTRAVDDLDVEHAYGDIFDTTAVSDAMRGCDRVFYCIVDTRAWLADPAPLFRTNVFGLRQVLNVASGFDMERFVFTSTISTIGRAPGRKVDENDACNWAIAGGPYAQSRLEAEDLVLHYAAISRVPAVAMCVSNTFGPNDFQPSHHGGLIAAAARGQVPIGVHGLRAESVGIEDAARALILAATRGRVGQRYIVSESYADVGELLAAAAVAGGHAAAPRVVPASALFAFGAAAGLLARTLKRDWAVRNLRMLSLMGEMDHRKAVAELGWEPEPVIEAVRRAAVFFTRPEHPVVS